MKSSRISLSLIALLFTASVGTAQTVTLSSATGKPGKKDTEVKTLDSDTQVTCQDYYAYYVGSGTPGPRQLQWVEVKDLGSLPGLVRFAVVEGPGVKYHRAAIGSDLCGVPISFFKGDNTGKFFIQPAHTPLSRSSVTNASGGTCLAGCDACSAFAKYRVVYDVSTDELCVQRWVRPHGSRPARWVSVNDRIIRPGVNRMVDVKYVNFNSLRDSLSLDFQWDQYNVEGADDFRTAVMRGPATPPAPAKEQEAKPAQTDTAKAALQPATSARTALTAAGCKDLLKELDTLRTVHTDLVTQLKRDHANADLEKFRTRVNKIVEELGFPMDMDGDVAYRKQLDSAFIGCKPTWGADAVKVNDILTALRDARGTYQRKLDLDALDAMAQGYAAVEEEARRAPVTPSYYDLRDTLVAIARKHFPKRFAGVVDASALKALGDIADKAKDAGILGNADAVTAYKKKAETMAKTYDDLTTYRTNSIAPLQMHDYDVLRLQFKKNGKALNASPYEIHTSGGWKIDFSSGIVFSKVRDEEYFYKALRSVTTTRSDTTISTSSGDTTTTITNVDSTRYFGTIGAETPNEVDWGLTIMAHFYPRTGLVFNPAISLGMLVKQDGVSPMLGFTLLYGRKHRVALTGGAIFANVMRLKPGYDEDSEYEVTPTTGVNAEVPNTERVIRLGFFASLTYNFAGARLTVR